jgi:hypothetical protein
MEDFSKQRGGDLWHMLCPRLGISSTKRQTDMQTAKNPARTSNTDIRAGENRNQ